MLKYRLHWSLVPGKTQEWFNRMIKEQGLTEDEIAREYEINYSLSVSGKVFNAFKADRHVTNEFVYNPALPVYRIWDFGKTNVVLYLQRDSKARVNALHERVLTDSTTTEQKTVALADSGELFPDAHFRDICDPAGSYDDYRGTRTDVQILENGEGYDECIKPAFYRIKELPTQERKVRGRGLIMKDLQTSPAGRESFQLYCSDDNTDGCSILKKAFQGGYCYKKDHAGNMLDRINEMHPYEDVIDCLIYFYLETAGAIVSRDEYIEPWSNNDTYVNPYTGV